MKNDDKDKRKKEQSRDDYVKGFRVDIGSDNAGASREEPKYTGAVYFSNPPKRRTDASTQRKPQQGTSPRPADTRRNGNPQDYFGTPRPSQGQRPPSQGQRPPVQGQRPPVQGQRPPVQGQRPPVQGQRPPVQGQRPPVQGQRPPVQGQRPPVQGGSVPVSRRSNPSSAKSGTPKTKKKHARIAPAIAMILVVSILTTCISVYGISCINDILAMNRDESPVSVTIPEAASADEIVDILADGGLIKQRSFCKFFLSLKEKISSSQKKDANFLGGMYYLKPSMGLEAMLNEFKQQQSAKTVSLYFPEGWTIDQIFEKLEKYDVCSSDYLYSALKTVKFSYNFVNEIYEHNEAYLYLEGYMFPDTYEFFENENANSVIKKFLSNFEVKWTKEFSERAAELNLTMNDVIIIASIIQKEAANDEQMGLVSSVLHNRLNNLVNYPTIGCDSTANYVSGTIKNLVSDNELSLYNSLYNTHLCEGLPAGAICNPGMSAIIAALYPDDTNYYFFQHDKHGKIYMASTNAEHDRNKAAVIAANAQAAADN